MIDFRQIAATASLPDLAIKAGVALKRNGQEYEGLCPFHSEKTPSFQIYPYKAGDGWGFICQGCGEKGNALDFMCEAYGVDAKEAAKLIAGDTEALGLARNPAKPLNPISDPYKGWKIGRPPAEASIQVGKPVRVLNLKRNKHVTYEPVAVYPYDDKHSDLIGYVLRLEIDGRKLTPQVWYCTDGAYEGWCTYPHPDPRPLYGLGKLYEHPERQVLIVEGEKCRDAGERLFGDKLCVVTWMGGCNAVHKTYWKSLADRSCILWPDNDDAGRVAMFAVSEALKAQGCTIKQIDVKPDDGEKGQDIADLETLGREYVGKYMRDRIYKLC